MADKHLDTFVTVMHGGWIHVQWTVSYWSHPWWVRIFLPAPRMPLSWAKFLLDARREWDNG